MKNGFKSGEETEHLPKSQRGEVVLPLAERTGLQEEKGQEGKEKVRETKQGRGRSFSRKSAASANCNRL